MKFPIDIRMKTTALVVTILVITLGIYDLIVVVAGEGPSLSVSRFLVNVGVEAPMVVFMVGFACGHVWGFAKPVRAKDLPED